MILGLTIISVGIFNGLMLSFVFLNRKKPYPYLGLFIMAYCFVLGKFFFDSQPFQDQTNYLAIISDLIGWTIAPFLYFYIRSYRNKSSFNLPLHFLPTVLLLFLILIPGIQWIDLTHPSIHSTGRIIQGLIYLIILYKDVKDDTWLSSIAFLFFLELLSMLIHQVFHWENLLLIHSTPLSIILLIGFITFKSITTANHISATPNKRLQKPKNTTRNQETFELIQDKVEKSELYLNPNLKLSDLSRELGLSEKLISQAINESTGENMNLFINRYRIRTAERLLIEQSRHITIDAIAELSGFSNKVSFYKAFRRINIISPKEYIEVKTTKS